MLNLDESLEALKASVIGAVWASDIEVQFNSYPATSISDSNMLDKGIARFCQHSAIIMIARLFGKDDEISLKWFFKIADRCTDQFAQATEKQVKDAINAHNAWIKASESSIELIKRFRDKQIAHLDKSSVRDHFDGKLAGVSWEIGLDGSVDVGPDVVELSASMLTKIIEFVDIYSVYYDGQPFDLNYMRGKINQDCHEYIQHRLKQSAAIE